MSAHMKKIADLNVSEWAAKVHAGFENPITVTLNADGSGTISDSKVGSSAYFHTPADALHWLGHPETEIEV